MADRLRRILFIQAPKGGGSTIALYELVKGLDPRRYRPLVLFLHVNQYLEDFKALGIETFTFDKIQYSDRKAAVLGNLKQFLLADVPLAVRIARLLKAEKIDLIHHNFGFDRVVMLAAWLSRTRQLCHFRNFNRKIPWLVKVLMPSVDAALYTTQAIADHFSGLGVRVAKQSVVYEPIDVARFAGPRDKEPVRREFSVGDDGYLISNVGRITSWKGQDVFIEALAGVVPHYPGVKALLVGAPGDTDSDRRYLESLQAKVKALALAEHVAFTGNRHDIPELMAASDVVVHSAVKPEPFGLVIAEAMAAGTPVIATRGGGTPEIVDDGVTGLLVPMANAEAMQEALIKLLTSAGLRARLKQQAQAAVSERFSIDLHVAKVQAMYQDLLGQASP